MEFISAAFIAKNAHLNHPWLRYIKKWDRFLSFNMYFRKYFFFAEP